VFCARPRGQVIAALSDQFEREVRAEAIDLGEVLPDFRSCPHQAFSRFIEHTQSPAHRQHNNPRQPRPPDAATGGRQPKTVITKAILPRL
jgi:hypothetical protein